MIVFTRTKTETEALAEKLRARGLRRGRDQRRHRPGPARAHHQAAARRQARHPGRDRRRGARPRRGAHQPRGQLRHPDRHRVLRAPGRPHRARRAAPATRSRSSRRASGACSRRSSAPPGSRSRRCSCPRWTTSTRTRVARFDDAITAALGSEEIGVLPRHRRPTTWSTTTCRTATSRPRSPCCSQGDRPLLMAPTRSGRRRRSRVVGRHASSRARRGATRDEGPGRRGRDDAERSAERRQNRRDRHAVAGPGDLPHRRRQAPQGGAAPDRRRDRQRGRARPRRLRRIEIRGDFSLVELPADAVRRHARALERTRISGQADRAAPSTALPGVGSAAPEGPQTTMLTSLGARTITLRTCLPSIARCTARVGHRRRLQVGRRRCRARPPAGRAPCPAPARPR